ncbi:hypothetical protein SRABI27_02567 [Pedobacter sp. Bi27]|uniref:Bacteriocin n=1 Tax=Pedobacter ginsenosidimutans TaxID=687842 RepID=A0A0T5VRA4_9SPHI|nr:MULTISPECIES: hypothetical protein [Pedobacter]KRT16407.1 hypothetical protein ASU31_09580 [Pedobacter ginsenosidimutans]CAH0234672.1 hypothetical protein SRABI27_02567 [Pedobacter sp. Bi27]CAH0247965.1 hypothetical protein SRABI36_03139 [Pedobacter sp. Bi36]CAH0273126.1 hypothetical protein SRABI126_03539 [Pedobacter sp. Bi126]
MKNKKLEKRTQFIFKKKTIINLDNDQLRRINGGSNPTGGGHSGNPQCDELKTVNQTVSG